MVIFPLSSLIFSFFHTSHTSHTSHPHIHTHTSYRLWSRISLLYTSLLYFYISFFHFISFLCFSFLFSSFPFFPFIYWSTQTHPHVVHAMASLVRVTARSHLLLSQPSTTFSRIAAFHTFHTPTPAINTFLYHPTTSHKLPSVVSTEETIRICGNYDAGDDDEKLSKVCIFASFLFLLPFSFLLSPLHFLKIYAHSDFTPAEFNFYGFPPLYEFSLRSEIPPYRNSS